MVVQNDLELLRHVKNYRQRRRKEALDALTAIAGEDPEALIRDLCGSRNYTFSAICKHFRGRSDVLAKELIKVLPHSRAEFHIGGWDVSKNFYQSAVSADYKVTWHSKGCKRHKAAEGITDAWTKAAHNDSSGNLVTVQAKRTVASGIASEHGCSLATAYRYGSDVKRKGKVHREVRNSRLPEAPVGLRIFMRSLFHALSNGMVVQNSLTKDVFW